MKINKNNGDSNNIVVGLTIIKIINNKRIITTIMTIVILVTI